MADRARTKGWLDHVLIVPDAHVRISDFAFQAATYEQFHVSWATRILHMICTPTVLIAALVLLNALPLGIEINDMPLHIPVGGVVLAAGLAAYLIGLDTLVGLVSIPIVALLLVASNLLTSALGGHAVAVATIMSIVAACAQAGSHLFEDVPPPWSGDQPRPLRDVLRGASPLLVLGLVGLTLVSPMLEWWASFRVLGLQINFVLMRLGRRPDLGQRLARPSAGR